MIRFDQVTKVYKNTAMGKNTTIAVQDVSFQVKKGEIFGLAGNSGCGKTTLIRLLLQLQDRDSGSIYYQDRDISLFSKEERKDFSRKVQIIFQNPESSMNPAFTVKGNILEPLKIHGLYSKRESLDKLVYYMDLLGLSTHLLKRYPHEISGGEAQRLILCRALSLEPEVLLLDEPTSMLDVSIQAHIMYLLSEIHKKLDLTYIYISHDLLLHKLFTDRIMILSQGQVVEIGDTKKVLENLSQEYSKSLVNSFFQWTREENI